MNKSFILFLKGFLMGICDLVPGISGGTIAFITGIYEELIKTLSHLKFENLKKGFDALLSFDSKKISNFFKEMNFSFLLILVLGILSAIILGSKLIKFLLENYNVYLFTFFVGLILASTKIMCEKVKNKKTPEILFALLGFLIGFLIIFISPQNLTQPSLLYLFLGGFIAISAMFLPGISGSYLLLILGLYEYIINILNSVLDNLVSFGVFILGLISGILLIPKGIKFLFEKYKSKTLMFLIGLVLGSLGVILRDIFSQIPEGLISKLVLVVLFIFGILIVFLSKRIIR